MGYEFVANLVYRASRDGWLYSDFHKFCDNKGALLVLEKVDNGRLCGGFCSISWNSSSSYVKDDKSFLFSLDLSKKYQSSNQQHDGHLYFGKLRGPYFGDNGSLATEWSTPLNQANAGICLIN